MKQWFQTLNNRQFRTVIPGSGETNEIDLTIQIIIIKDVPDHIPGWENLGGRQWLYYAVEMGLGVQEVQVAEC